MTLTFILDVYSVEMNKCANIYIYPGQKSSTSKSIVETHGHTHTHTITLPAPLNWSAKL